MSLVISAPGFGVAVFSAVLVSRFRWRFALRAFVLFLVRFGLVDGSLFGCPAYVFFM